MYKSYKDPDDYFDDTKYDNQIENAKDFNCDDDCEDNDAHDDEVALDFIYDDNASINFIHAAGYISSAKHYCLNDNESQSNLMSVSIDIEPSYCYQSTSCLSNVCSSTIKSLISSSLHPLFGSNPFQN
ncbi:unnamed protein product [Rotaria socialis]|uniref:Uncharacterized protein n=1 Tax=Rotaria socialis TaxID=392032 RepID=A0A820BWF2_9BILA|nr:unnamed protein product [Rotaria socialis]CAF3604328.1 unnamed protein product [Rotaria socialis]CAF4206865.1 unnamed protein product [Rotaria socialis]CAF4274758.1 unnamed protein product [Rotaria socialis]CAF4362767.1 unnamed protein product [Rotaria socialis]